MNDNIFFDTNIILYTHSLVDDRKSIKSRQLINNSYSVISIQVMQETCNGLIKKFKMDKVSVSDVIIEMNKNFEVRLNTLETLHDALHIHFKYQYAYYDSLIIASALQNNCFILYSEDLHHNQKIEKSLQIINPFI